MGLKEALTLPGIGYLGTTFEERGKHLEKGKLGASLPLSPSIPSHTKKTCGLQRPYSQRLQAGGKVTRQTQHVKKYFQGCRKGKLSRKQN